MLLQYITVSVTFKREFKLAMQSNACHAYKFYYDRLPAMFSSALPIANEAANTPNNLCARELSRFTRLSYFLFF